MRDMLAQPIFGLCCGCEDVGDHNVLRRDLALQTAVGRVDALASAPTLSRLETSATREHAAALHGVLLDQFIASKSSRPKELILDIDATHRPLHGAQQKAHFHRYCDNYRYRPLQVFCGQDILACVLRPSSRDPASILSASIKLITRRLRQAWPRVRIVVRGDSGFGRPQALRRFEKWGRHYIVGLQKNFALLQRVALAELALAAMYRHDAHGANPRFIAIRVKLLKIGAAIIRNTRRVRMLLASQHRLQHVFISAARALAP